MNRPIESRTLGEVVVNEFQIREYAPGALILVGCFREADGDLYERIRMVMPASAIRWPSGGGGTRRQGESPPSRLQ